MSTPHAYEASTLNIGLLIGKRVDWKQMVAGPSTVVAGFLRDGELHLVIVHESSGDLWTTNANSLRVLPDQPPTNPTNPVTP